jgi:hypothetical protein
MGSHDDNAKNHHRRSQLENETSEAVLVPPADRGVRCQFQWKRLISLLLNFLS